MINVPGQHGVVINRDPQTVGLDSLVSASGWVLKPNDPLQVRPDHQDLSVITPDGDVLDAWYLQLEDQAGIMLVATKTLVGTVDSVLFTGYEQDGTASSRMVTRTLPGKNPQVVPFQEGYYVSTDQRVFLLVQPPKTIVAQLNSSLGITDNWWYELQWLDITPNQVHPTSSTVGFKITNYDSGGGVVTRTPAGNSAPDLLDNNTATPAGNNWEGGEVLLYWFAYYSSWLGVYLPVIQYTEYLDDLDPVNQRVLACTVSTSAGFYNGAIIDISDMSAYNDPVEYNEFQLRFTLGVANKPLIFNKIRIFRHRCVDSTEANAVLNGNVPLQGALIKEMEVNDSGGVHTATWQDHGTERYDGSVSWPLTSTRVGDAELVTQRLYAKQPFTTGAQFQGAMVTDAPYISNDIVLFTPPASPLDNPPVFGIHLSTTGNDSIVGMVELNGSLLVLMKESVQRLNYVPYGANIQATSVTQQVLDDFGCAGRQAWVAVSRPEGRSVIFLNSEGNLIETAGAGYRDACPNFNLFDSDIVDISRVVLENDPFNHRILLWGPSPLGGAIRFEFYYHETHLLGDRFKLMGPTDLAIQALTATRGRGNGGTRVWYVGSNAVWLVGGASSHMNASLKTGVFRNPDPGRHLTIQAFGFLHSTMNPEATVRMRLVRAYPDQDGKADTFIDNNRLTRSGYKHVAVSKRVEDWAQLEVRLNLVTTDVTLGPFVLDEAPSGGKPTGRRG